MEDVINGFITKELVTNQEFLPIENDLELIKSRVLDSLSLLKLVMFVEEHFGISIDPEEVVPGNFGSVDLICKYLRTKGKA